MMKNIGPLFEIIMLPHVDSYTDRYDEGCSATLMAVAVSQNQAFLVWIGSEQAKLVRSGYCPRETSPHIFVVPNGFVINTDFLRASARKSNQKPTYDSWGLTLDDVLVIADYRLFSALTNKEIAANIGDDELSAARRLVELAQSRRDDFAQTAMVVRMRRY